MVPDGIQLADPRFTIPAPVQLLLGAEVWAKVAGNINYKNQMVTVLQETHLGYICFGRVNLTNLTNENNCEFMSYSLQINEMENSRIK